MTGGGYGELHSFNLDGSPGTAAGGSSPPRLDHRVGGRRVRRRAADRGGGGADGRLRSWRIGKTLAALEGSTAREVEIRELSLGSLVASSTAGADRISLGAAQRAVGALGHNGPS